VSQNDFNLDRKSIVGVLLAGGLGRRMGGGDKGLVPLAGRPLISFASDSLAPQVGALVLNANGDPARFSILELPAVADESTDFPGPLAGVLAALKWMARAMPHSALLASLPADVPFAPPDLVVRLARALSRHPEARVAVAQSRGRRHHVTGLWRRSAACEIEAALAQGHRKAETMVDRLGAVAVPFADIVIGGRAVDPFFNVNTREDLAYAAEVLGQSSPPLLWDGEMGNPEHLPPGAPPPPVPPHKGEGSPFVVGIAGWKNSGKTTLVVKLVRALAARGYRVSTIKHSHHALSPDDTGTDSARHREAGADEVLVVSPGRWMLGTAVHDEPEPLLAALLARLAPADIVLVEGYKRAEIAKIEVRRRGQGEGPPLAADDPRVIAIASDEAAGIERAGAVPVRALDDAEGLADVVLAAAGLPARKSRGIGSP